jgi:hypothetical protein
MYYYVKLQKCWPRFTLVPKSTCSRDEGKGRDDDLFLIRLFSTVWPGILREWELTS